MTESNEDDQPLQAATKEDDGVDVTLIRWFLSLTPLERLQAVQSYANSIMKLRDANPHL